MNFFGSNQGPCGGYDDNGAGFGGCGCDPCTLILLLMLTGSKGQGCGSDPCSLIWTMLILNCLCPSHRHNGHNC